MTKNDFNHLATFNPKTGKVDISVTPAGLKWAATPVTRDYIKTAGIDERFVIFHKFNTKPTLCLMVLCEENTARWYNNDQKQEEKKSDRLNRCMIPSEKTGRPVRCSDSNLCAGCPYAVMNCDTAAPVSYEILVEENRYEAEIHDATSDIATTSIAIEQLMDELSDEKEQLPAILKLRMKGLTPKEISNVLGIKKSTLYDNLKTIEKIASKYF